MKERLDKLLVNRNLAPDIKEAQALIGAGKVLVGQQRADKAGNSFAENVEITIKKQLPYVSRGGLKLAAGLDFFNLSPANLICADIGASTGGFTDCLLQNGATKVYAVDVGYGQLAWKLRQDSRVVVIERFNARKLTSEQIPDPIDLAVIDAAFISLRKLIPPLLPLFRNDISILGLIKPQFELSREKIGKGGVVRDSQLHEEAVQLVCTFALKNGLTVQGVTPSPILGPKGNREFLILLRAT